MNREKRRLFLSDLDGTLLNDEKKITPETRKALDSFAAAGGVFAICTGRAYESARVVYDTLNLHYPDSCIVSYNGALIVDPHTEKKIFRTGVPLEMTDEILSLGRKAGIHVHTYAGRYIVGESYNEEMAFYRRYIHTPVIINEDPMQELKVPPCKLIAISLTDRDRLEQFRILLRERYGDKLTLIFSNDYYLEIFPKEAGKGAAVHRLAEYLNIPMENTMAAGDAENDLSMIIEAGLGIGMCNGSDLIKRNADVVTATDNNHDGLVPFLRNWS